MEKLLNEWNLTFPWRIKNVLVSTGKNKRNKERNKREDAKFYQIKINLSKELELYKVQAEAKVIMTNINDDQNSYRWLQYNTQSFLISTVETLK